jgi:DEAD/DEAH box helicase domain-containing protein
MHADTDIAPASRRLLDALVAARPQRATRMTHVEWLPARAGQTAPWPAWVDERVVHRLGELGIDAPWEHQVVAATHAHEGRSVIVATGTASGKSLAYQLPALTALLAGAEAPNGRGATTLYIAPTKALAADQARRIAAFELRGVRAACLDGDTSAEDRDWVRAHATYVLTNPDMLHHTVLPGHARWASFLRRLRYVVIDECHAYRGVFGSHVALVIRRLRRIAARYGSDPVFVLASATVAQPETSGSRLIGREIVAVTDNTAPRGELAFALWEPPLTDRAGERGAPVRRTATAEAAELLTDLATSGVRSVAFTRSRRAAELVSIMTRESLERIEPGLGARVAAYRAGYLRDDRRALEAALHGDANSSSSLLAVAATSALELGVDVAGLDAVLLAGYPGTRASLWQQAGRAGRGHEGALAVMIARDDPLDTFLVHHPDAVFRQPIEATVLDPENPYVLAPQLCAAAAEYPLRESDEALFGATMPEVLDELVARGLLRRRAAGWYWTRAERPSALADLRGSGGEPVRLVESDSGRLLGTVDAAAAHTAVHPHAVYLHQGLSYVVRSLDLDDNVALIDRADPDYTTIARDVAWISVLDIARRQDWGPVELSYGSVEVTSQVVGFLRRRAATGEVLGEQPLDLPPRTLRTRAVWWTIDDEALTDAGLAEHLLAGAAHAAEHASIGLLPLFAGCDRWDIGGVSTARHPDTGLLTVFVHDGHPGGAGFAERAFHAARKWLTATRDVIAACECAAGCPSCVQSPKCGNGNQPLDKTGAVLLLDIVLNNAKPEE